MRCKHFRPCSALGCPSKEGLPLGEIWATLQPENHRVPCSRLCPHLKQKAVLEPGNQVSAGGGAEISGQALGCSSVLRTSDEVSPLQVCPVCTLLGRRSGELVVHPPQGCHTCLTSPSLSPSAFSVPDLAPGPYPSLWSQEGEVSLSCTVWEFVREGVACIQITPWKIKHCLKGLREGLVQTGTAWFPCGRRPGLERVGRRKEGRGERDVVSASPLRVFVFVFPEGTSKCVLLCVRVCDLVHVIRGELISVSVFLDLSLFQGGGFWSRCPSVGVSMPVLWNPGCLYWRRIGRHLPICPLVIGGQGSSHPLPWVGGWGLWATCPSTPRGSVGL